MEVSRPLERSFIMIKNELQIFNNPEFGEIRTVEEDGRVLFCGSDVAKALGYTNPSKALSDHCKGVTKRYTPTKSGTQEMSFIPESDVYRLAFGSKLPNAERLTDWIVEEVIPSIRKHGAYMTPEVIERTLTDPDYIIQLATTLKEERQKRKALESENERQKQVIADFEPIRQYVDTILESAATLTITQIAADYDLSARTLNKILNEEGVQHMVNGQWILYKRHMGMGYTKSKTIQFTRSDGTPDTKMSTQWTQKGRLFLHNILTARGITAIMDRTLAC